MQRNSNLHARRRQSRQRKKEKKRKEVGGARDSGVRHSFLRKKKRRGGGKRGGMTQVTWRKFSNRQRLPSAGDGGKKREGGEKKGREDQTGNNQCLPRALLSAFFRTLLTRCDKLGSRKRRRKKKEGAKQAPLRRNRTAYRGFFMTLPKKEKKKEGKGEPKKPAPNTVTFFHHGARGFPYSRLEGKRKEKREREGAKGIQIAFIAEEYYTRSFSSQAEGKEKKKGEEKERGEVPGTCHKDETGPISQSRLSDVRSKANEQGRKRGGEEREKGKEEARTYI